MAQITVSSQAEFLSALSAAQGGDTIYLADGDYGSVLIKSKFAANVTISSINPQGAVFERIVMQGASNITFQGVETREDFRAWYGSSNISAEDVLSKTFYFKNVDGLNLERSEATGGVHGIILNDVRNFVIRDSYFHHVTQDVFRITGDSYNGLIENNRLHETVASPPTHPDLMQVFSYGGYTPHDITIRGNHLWDDPATGNTPAQGLFFGMPGATGYKNILIENNILAVAHTNTIFMNGGQENVVIRNNTLMDDGSGKAGIIRLSAKSGFDNSGITIEGNILRALHDETKNSAISDNFIYKLQDLATLFSGSGDDWRDFLPHTAMGGAESYGAVDLLREMQAKYAPAPTPEPVVDSEHTLTEDPVPQLVFGLEERHLFTGNMDRRVIRIDHDEAMEIDQGTISFDFNADVTGWQRTLVSKDAAGEGDHFSVMLDQGTLRIAFGDETSHQKISVSGMKAKTDYNFVASFDEDGARVWLDGKLVGEVDIDMDWSDNAETLVLGADNSVSPSGTTSGGRYAYDGYISNFAIHDIAMTPEELQAHLSSSALLG